jgi:Flp pilus assembly protein TadD/septal ring-binding cell division protein DamX
VTKTSFKSHRSRCRDRLLKGTPVAFVLALLLAACQGPGSPDTLAPGKNVEQLMHVADDTRANGDLGTAVDLYRRAAEMASTDPRPLLALGSTLAQLHAYTEAAATYRAGLKIQPNAIEAELRRGLAIVLLSLNQPDGAIAELNLGITNAPEDPRLYSTLGVAHDLMGRHDLAQQDYRNGLQLAPKNQGLRNNYGLSLALSGDYAAAAVTLSELADDANATPRHRLNLALVYGLAGDDRKAGAIARSALDESAVKSNLAYYAMLRSMDDHGRANAIMGGQLRGTSLDPVALTEPTPPRAGAEEQAKTAAVEPAPRVPVKTKALAPSPSPAPAELAEPAQVADAPQSSATSAETAAAPVQTPDDAAMAEPTSLIKTEAPASEPQPLPSEASVPTPAEASAPTPAEATAAATPSEATGAAAPIEPAPSMAMSEPAPAASAVAKHGSKAVGFAVQAGSFASETNARKLAEQLNHKGYEVAVVHRKDHEGRDWFAVRAGGYGSEDEAAAAARHMRDSEQVPAVVVHLHGASQA